MDTDSLHLAFAHNSLDNCLKAELTETWNTIQKNDCNKEFSAKSTSNFFCRTRCERYVKDDEGEHELFKEEFQCTEITCLCSKTYCRFDKSTDKIKFSSEGLIKRTLEESGVGPLEKKQTRTRKENECSMNRSGIPNN